MKRLLIMTIVAMMGVAAQAQTQQIKQINAKALDEIVSRDSVQLVDVRTPQEYAQGRIAYAVNIDVKNPEFKAQALSQLDKKKPVYVYCRSGKRSMTAAQLLAAEGYEVVNLTGGILEWNGYSQEKANGR